VRDCTKPGDRLLVTWFAPEFYFYAERGFSGRQLFWFRGYLSSQVDQHASIERLQSDAVPIIISRVSKAFPSEFKLVHDYIVQNYRLAQESNFDERSDEVYQVYVDGRRTPSGTYAPLSLPCYS
jgi:hypothetical protein